MTVNEAIEEAREYMRRESDRIPFGEISFNVSLHKGDIRKLNFTSTHKVQHNPSEGPRHDNSTR